MKRLLLRAEVRAELVHSFPHGQSDELRLSVPHTVHNISYSQNIP